MRDPMPGAKEANPVLELEMLGITISDARMLPYLTPRQPVNDRCDRRRCAFQFQHSGIPASNDEHRNMLVVCLTCGQEQTITARQAEKFLTMATGLAKRHGTWKP